MNGKAAVIIGSESDRDIIESSRKYFEYFTQNIFFGEEV